MTAALPAISREKFKKRDPANSAGSLLDLAVLFDYIGFIKEGKAQR